MVLATGAGLAIAQDEQSEGVSEPDTVTEGIREMPMGQICWAAIIEAVSEIGKRCMEEEGPDIRTELDRSNAAMGKMMLDAGWSESDLAGFRKQMGNHDAPTDALCGNDDGLEFYLAVARSGAEEIAKTTDTMLERSGPPEWGTCL